MARRTSSSVEPASRSITGWAISTTPERLRKLRPIEASLVVSA
ncbi:hypothetical protein [Xylophilus rhododendri]|nr:hypothetical protein [Xylophilus rhododendri]